MGPPFEDDRSSIRRPDGFQDVSELWNQLTRGASGCGHHVDLRRAGSPASRSTFRVCDEAAVGRKARLAAVSGDQLLLTSQRRDEIDPAPLALGAIRDPGAVGGESRLVV